MERTTQEQWAWEDCEDDLKECLACGEWWSDMEHASCPWCEADRAEHLAFWDEERLAARE